AQAGGVLGVGAWPAVWRTGLVAIVLFTVCGYAPARLMLPADLREHLPLYVLPFGAACAALELTVLGLLRVPFAWSLPVVLVGSALAAVAVHGRAGRPRPPAFDGRRVAAIVLPLLLAGLVAAVALVPVFRTGFATVIGQNGDAVMAVGTAEFLRNAPPTANRPELPVDEVPIVWRSKLPIYYALAAVASLAGQDPVVAFPTVIAVMLGLVALGLFLLARVVLAASLVAALAVTFLVPLDRIVIHLAIHPFYNQLWGLFTLPFTLLFGWRFLRDPGRRTLAPLALFALLGVFAYPLLLPFPAVFLGVCALLRWRRARAQGRSPGWIAALRLPRVRDKVAFGALAVLALPFVVVLLRGVIEKMFSAGHAIVPGGDLSGWSGPALDYLPFARFFGVDGTGLIPLALTLGVFALAVLAARRMPRDVTVAAGVTAAGALAFALYFLLREDGELFWFKILGFLGPLVLTFAVIGLVGLLREARGVARRTAAVLGAILLVLVVNAGAAREIDATFEYATAPLLELDEWDERLPAGASVRIDVPPTGYQLWTWYMLDDRPVSVTAPLGGFFPHPPIGLTGDFALIEAWAEPPSDAAGRAVLRNAGYAVYPLRPNGAPDVSSQELVWPYTKINPNEGL
ncbi:MAG: hypothetical protein M3370_05315, partial [Actinomycetota bacterium]|nr:hypothetical protein [Actinomycetota bacterium]